MNRYEMKVTDSLMDCDRRDKYYMDEVQYGLSRQVA